MFSIVKDENSNYTWNLLLIYVHLSQINAFYPCIIFSLFFYIYIICSPSSQICAWFASSPRKEGKRKERKIGKKSFPLCLLYAFSVFLYTSIYIYLFAIIIITEKIVLIYVFVYQVGRIHLVFDAVLQYARNALTYSQSFSNDFSNKEEEPLEIKDDYVALMYPLKGIHHVQVIRAIIVSKLYILNIALIWLMID